MEETARGTFLDHHRVAVPSSPPRRSSKSWARCRFSVFLPSGIQRRKKGTGIKREREREREREAPAPSYRYSITKRTVVERCSLPFRERNVLPIESIGCQWRENGAVFLKSPFRLV